MDTNSFQHYWEHPESTSEYKFWTKFGPNDTIWSLICHSLFPLCTNYSSFSPSEQIFMDLEPWNIFEFWSCKSVFFMILFLFHKVHKTIMIERKFIWILINKILLNASIVWNSGALNEWCGMSWEEGGGWSGVQMHGERQNHKLSTKIIFNLVHMARGHQKSTQSLCGPNCS